MKNLKICLAEDDIDDREIFQDAFEQLASEHKLTVFENGREALDYLNNSEVLPDIIFLDLNMPIMGGLETLREIRKDDRLKSLSVAIYSTSSSEKDIEDTLAAGANIYIVKPSNFVNLKETLRKTLKINWQYHSSGLSKETFVFVL